LKEEVEGEKNGYCFLFSEKKSVKNVGRGPSLHTEVKAGPVPGYSGQEASLTVAPLLSARNADFDKNL
jgi:hypothetical protein